MMTVWVAGNRDEKELDFTVTNAVVKTVAGQTQLDGANTTIIHKLD